MNQQRWFFILGLLLIFGSGIYIQSQLLINCDVSHFLLTSPTMLTGGTYSQDVFEPNPPMAFFLQAIPLGVAALLKLNIIPVFQAYIFALIALSLLLCYSLAQKILQAQQLLLFMLTVASLFLIFPLDNFGQREHILLMLIMPYLLLVVLRMQGQTTGKTLPLFIGLLAGIGFCIKPYFMLALLLTESYYLWQTKSLAQLRRPEMLMIMLVTACYIIVVFAQYPDYIFAVAPVIKRIYFSGYRASWPNILFNPLMMFCYYAWFIYFLQRAAQPLKILNNVLMLACVSFTFCVFVQLEFFYQKIPALFFAVLLIVLNLHFHGAVKMWFAAGLAIFLGIYIYLIDNNIDSFVRQYPGGLFAYLSIFFAGFMYAAQTKKNLLLVVTRVGVIIAAGIVINHYSTLLALLLMLILFSAMLPVRTTLLSAMLAMLAFIVPYDMLFTSYLFSHERKAAEAPLIAFLHTHAHHQPVALLSAALMDYYPAVLYADAIPVGRVNYLIWIPSVLNRHSVAALADHNYLLHLTLSDFKQTPPQYVFVDIKTPKNFINVKSFDYLTFLSANPEFKNFWQHYHFVTTLQQTSSFGIPFYKLAVYQRS